MWLMCKVNLLLPEGCHHISLRLHGRNRASRVKKESSDRSKR